MGETTSPLKDSKTKGGIHTPQESMESKRPARTQEHEVEEQCEVTQQETTNGSIIIRQRITMPQEPPRTRAHSRVTLH